MDAHSLRLVLDNCLLGKEFLLYANTVGIASFFNNLFVDLPRSSF